VNDSLARKIQGLSVLTGKSASDLTDDLSHIIEGHITQQLIHAVGITPEDLNVVRSGFMQPVGYENGIPEGTTVTTTHDFDDQSTNEALIFPADEEDDTWSKATKEDDFSMAAGLGASEEEFDNYDEALPEEAQSEFILPGEDKEEIQTMPIKDKDGNQSGYDDPIMAELQEELEDGSLDGYADDDYDYDDDEREFEEDVSVKPRARVSGVVGNDAPTGEDGYTPDVLPVDFGIDKVSSEDGRSGGAMDFFNNAFDGIQGDKSRRNNVSRKRIITDF
jgi:hypothetical protein